VAYGKGRLARSIRADGDINWETAASRQTF
jgi:hypothetical protein